MREFSKAEFDKKFAALATDMRWQEIPEYYPRYRECYVAMSQQFAALDGEDGLDTLEISGGQLAYLGTRLWQQDEACVAHLTNECFPDLQQNGIDTFQWNLACEDSPVDRQFNVIFFSEVIKHLPVPGHVALERLRKRLRPGGLLLCSTPNLYRLRNIYFLVTGRRLFDHSGLEFADTVAFLSTRPSILPGNSSRRGFTNVSIEFRHFAYIPNKPTDRAFAVVGTPLLRIPRYWDNRLAVARI